MGKSNNDNNIKFSTITRTIQAISNDPYMATYRGLEYFSEISSKIFKI
jgi:hypothetical protein